MIIISKIQKSLFLVIFFSFAIALLSVLLGAKNPENMQEYENIDMPIIMYHSLLKDKKSENDFTVSPLLFEEDLKYIVQNGYTTVTVDDIVNFVYSNKALPSKCIMLTFDDGYYNNYYYAYPLLKKYGCRAVISPIASVTEQFTSTGEISASYGYLNIDNIKEMVNSGCVEIQNHSYDMHSLAPRRGVEQKTYESDKDYKTTIVNDITTAQEYLKNNVGVTPNCFVYPFGAKSKGTLEIIKELGFVSTMTCTEKLNIITKNPDSLYELGRYRRVPTESIEHLLNRINKQ